MTTIDPVRGVLFRTDRKTEELHISRVSSEFTSSLKDISVHVCVFVSCSYRAGWRNELSQVVGLLQANIIGTEGGRAVWSRADIFIYQLGRAHMRASIRSPLPLSCCFTWVAQPPPLPTSKSRVRKAEFAWREAGSVSGCISDEWAGYKSPSFIMEYSNTVPPSPGLKSSTVGGSAHAAGRPI